MIYGSIYNPQFHGSGGGNYDGITGSSGGGIMYIYGTQEITLKNSIISANGGAPGLDNSKAGSGSGGSI